MEISMTLCARGLARRICTKSAIKRNHKRGTQLLPCPQQTANRHSSAMDLSVRIQQAKRMHGMVLKRTKTQVPKGIKAILHTSAKNYQRHHLTEHSLMTFPWKKIQ